MTLNKDGYKEVARRGYYGAGGQGGRSAITLEFEGHPLFSKKFLGEVKSHL